MMIIRFYLLLTFLFAGTALLGQDYLSIKVLKYRYNLKEQDSTLLYQSDEQRDSLGRLIFKKAYHYYPGQSRISKEEHVLWDSKSSTLKEKTISYRPKSSTKVEKLNTVYLHYDKEPVKCKHISRVLMDDLNNISKEDTLTYNTDSLLIKACTYKYTGNTVLLCDEYSYNKAEKRTRWKTHSIWTTVKMSGKVTEKRTKRRDYKYKYNRRGDLKCSKGVYYNNWFKQRLSYDKSGQLKKNVLQQGRKGKRDSKEVQTDIYQNGRKISSARIIGGKERNRNEYIYRDTLLTEHKQFERGKLTYTTQYFYTTDNKLDKKIKEEYVGSTSAHRKIIQKFMRNGKLSEEAYHMSNKILRRTVYKYTESGQPLEQKTFGSENQLIEKTVYIY